MGMVARDRPVELAPAPWPDIASEDPVGEVARRFVVNLRRAIDSKSLRSVAVMSGVSHVTIINILSGRVWPDLATIARLEYGLGVSLWPLGNDSETPS